MARSRYSLVSSYVGRSYLANFAVAFIFFFFIFFVNQILLIAQRILVKNVSLLSVLTLVTLAIPPSSWSPWRSPSSCSTPFPSAA